MISAKKSIDYVLNNVDISSKNTTVLSKSTSEINKSYNSKNNSNLMTSNKHDFKKVLNSKVDSKEDDTQKVVNSIDENKYSTDINDTSKVDELDKESESDSKDDVSDKVKTLLKLLNNLGTKDNLVEGNENSNSELLKTNILDEADGSLDNEANALNQLVELLKSDSVQKKLGNDSLKLIEKTLNQASAKFTNDSNGTVSDVKNGIKDLMSEISKMIDDKQDQGGKVLNLQEVLNNAYSRSNNGSFLDKISLNASSSQVIQGQKSENIEGLEINKDTFTTDLIKNVKFMSDNGLNELTAKVDSGNAGEITINLIQEDGIVKVNVKANSEETAALLSQNLVDIKDKLSEQNIKVLNVSSESYQDSTELFNQDRFESQLSQLAEVNESKLSTEVKDSSKVDELNEKLKKLEEDSKTDSKDDVNQILQSLLNLLNKLGVNENSVEWNQSSSSEVLKSTISDQSNVSLDNKPNVLNQLIELLKSDSAQKELGNDSLKLMEKMLNQLSAKLEGDNKETVNGVKNGIKDLVSEISKMIDNKQNQSEKVLNIEDELNKSYSQSNNSSLENESDNNKKAEVSKEDKFLSSLLDDNKDASLDKINLFASRSQIIQGQGTENNRAITINKATFTSDLVKDVKFMSNNGLKELTVKVNPGNLGEISISLTKEDGVIKASLRANSKETAELLSQNLLNIKDKLSQQHIKISDINIELYQDDTTFFNQSEFGDQLSEKQGKNNQNNNNNLINDGIVDEEDSMDDVIGSNNNLDFLA